MVMACCLVMVSRSDLPLRLVMGSCGAAVEGAGGLSGAAVLGLAEAACVAPLDCGPALTLVTMKERWKAPPRFGAGSPCCSLSAFAPALACALVFAECFALVYAHAMDALNCVLAFFISLFPFNFSLRVRACSYSTQKVNADLAR